MKTQSGTLSSIKRSLAFAGALSLAALSLSACGTSEGSNTSAGGDTFTLGVAEASTEIPFLATLDSAITAKAEELGMETIILNGDLDNAKQAANIKTLISRNVDAILVISSSPAAVVDAINEAGEAGIPVFAINAKLDDAAEVITYVGASDYEYGVAQGDLLIKALPDGGKVAVILGPLGNTPQVERLRGLEDAIKDHPEIEIIDQPVDNFDNAQNLAVTQDLLSKYPEGSLDAVVAQGPQMYVGANYALEQGRDDIAFIAGDYPQQIEEAIKSGAIYGTADQSPVLEGELAAQYAHDWLTGAQDKVKQPEHIIDLPLITKDNVDEIPSSWSF